MSYTHDVIIVGGGHNGLTAAAYLAKTGRSVLLLEALDYLGGAATSIDAFEGVDARLSRYAYLVSLLPEKIISALIVTATLYSGLAISRFSFWMTAISIIMKPMPSARK